MSFQLLTELYGNSISTKLTEAKAMPGPGLPVTVELQKVEANILKWSPCVFFFLYHTTKPLQVWRKRGAGIFITLRSILKRKNLLKQYNKGCEFHQLRSSCLNYSDTCIKDAVTLKRIKDFTAFWSTCFQSGKDFKQLPGVPPLFTCHNSFVYASSSQHS